MPCSDAEDGCSGRNMLIDVMLFARRRASTASCRRQNSRSRRPFYQRARPTHAAVAAVAAAVALQVVLRASFEARRYVFFCYAAPS
jgi:hypothetical protein